MKAGVYLAFGHIFHFVISAHDDFALALDCYNAFGQITSLDDRLDFSALDDFLPQLNSRDSARYSTSHLGSRGASGPTNAGHDSPIATSKSRSRLMASARPVETDTFHVHPNVQSHPSKASAEAVNTASPASSETHPDHEELSGGSHWNWKPGSMKDNPFFEQLLEYRPVSHLTEKVPRESAITNGVEIGKYHDSPHSSSDSQVEQIGSRAEIERPSPLRTQMEDQVPRTKSIIYENRPGHYDVQAANNNMRGLYQEGLDAYAVSLASWKKKAKGATTAQDVPTLTSSASSGTESDGSQTRNEVDDSTKFNLPRLEFDEMVFTYPDETGSHKRNLNIFLDLIEDHPENRLIVPENELRSTYYIFSAITGVSRKSKPIGKRERRKDKDRYNFLKDKNQELLENEEVWYNYWEVHTGKDFKTYLHKVASTELRHIFVQFLFYVEMITVVTLKPEGQAESEYILGLERACESFLEFSRNFARIGLDNKIYYRLGRYRRGEQALLWVFLESWLKNYHKSFWIKHSVIFRHKLHMPSPIKTFFNNTFGYSIKNLNERYTDWFKKLSIGNSIESPDLR
ncbi:hypothetical protein MJO29_001393 [Puccinia striiformis f. sp. tritici]|uniref:hypothetical protein n=1 Tax=Puccinia striiformis f. sp. tritici TaxID=168172 RepID=UPI0020076D7E|nr:hypothetical protein Pst134EA_003371 [Puccinia striiformis f. sp. tritici]KAH9472767.1 hypothetical protein Pst134EA_003371 [Puccinia striiformis f. sp. tritici]KAI7965645.1 hypothetical protein MJO29_001393 [Puccinia striiformis f. sp. tritici]KAI9619900.1 hypothetical protein KEM48_008394 [Puccinia striiformis f. sp. tritici PST-130]